MNELSPRVSMDPALGQYVSDCAVNYDALVTYMQSRGMSDADIAGTNIVIATDDVKRKRWSIKDKSSTTITRLGNYKAKTATINVYPMGYIQDGRDTLASAFDLACFDEEDDITFYSDHTSSLVNMTLLHEIEHRALKSDKQLQSQVKKHDMRLSAKIAGMFMGYIATPEGVMYANEVVGPHLNEWYILAAYAGGFAATTSYVFKSDMLHRSYLSNPEEIRCREAETASEEKFISLRLKPLVES